MDEDEGMWVDYLVVSVKTKRLSFGLDEAGKAAKARVLKALIEYERTFAYPQWLGKLAFKVYYSLHGYSEYKKFRVSAQWGVTGKKYKTREEDYGKSGQ
jgi:hypothetical protein